jgi:dipeptidyl aminopeptidase/acylaminoacyl peptidase
MPPRRRGRFPTILETHDGPTAVQTNDFNPGAQAWVDHGFAFLTINYRGSVTFGREFKQKIWRDLRHWEVEGMKAAYHWLVDEGIARPKEVFLTATATVPPSPTPPTPAPRC